MKKGFITSDLIFRHLPPSINFDFPRSLQCKHIASEVKPPGPTFFNTNVSPDRDYLFEKGTLTVIFGATNIRPSIVCVNMGCFRSRMLWAGCEFDCISKCFIDIIIIIIIRPSIVCVNMGCFWSSLFWAGCEFNCILKCFIIIIIIIARPINVCR